MHKHQTLAVFPLASTASAQGGSSASGLLADLASAPPEEGGLWVGPTFVAAMILGGLTGLHLPLMEQGVALTVLVLGVLALVRSLPLGLGMAVLGAGLLIG